jgi:hypothetical protein
MECITAALKADDQHFQPIGDFIWLVWVYKYNLLAHSQNIRSSVTSSFISADW